MRGPHMAPPRPDMPGSRMPAPHPGPVRPEGAFPPGPGGGDFGPRGPPPGGPRGPLPEQGPRPGMTPEHGPRPMGPGGLGPLPGPGQGHGQGPSPRPGPGHFPEGDIRPPHGMGPGVQLPPRVRIISLHLLTTVPSLLKIIPGGKIQLPSAELIVFDCEF